MTMRSRSAAAFAAIAFAALPEHSRAVQPTAPSFRADTRLVQVSVVTRAADGAPVPGLTRDDFMLLDDGREQAIELFAADAFDAATPGRAIGPGDYSNLLGGRTGGSVTAILFDRLNTRAEHQRRARDQVMKFLGQIRREDRVAIYVLDGGSVRVVHDFTADAGALVAALSGEGVRAPVELDATETESTAALAAFLMETAPAIAAASQTDRVSATVNALMTIANRLAGIRGRKNLVWVSSGFPLPLRNGTTAAIVDRAARAIDDENIAIYPVDARGLTDSGAGRAEELPLPGFATPPLPDVPKRPASAAPPNLDAMRAIAEDTGGVAFVNRNDVSVALRRALDDSRFAYILGYYPAHNRWDGAFHQINVRVKRPGVEVRHRRGYIARPVAAAPLPEDALLAEVSSPLEATGIGLSAHVTRAEADGSAGLELTAAIHVDPGVTFRKDGDTWIASLELVVAQETGGGRVYKTLGGTVDLRLSDDRREQVAKSGFSFTRTIPLRADAARLRLVLRDTATGALGSLIIPTAR